MSQNLQTLVKFDDWRASIDRDNDTLIRTVVKAMWEAAVRHTPRDLGWAQYNWRVRNRLGGRLGRNKMRKTYPDCPWNDKAFTTDRAVYLFNHVIYIDSLNDGHSTKGGNMFGHAIAAARNVLGG